MTLGRNPAGNARTIAILMAAVMLVAFLLRSLITVVPPAMKAISADLHLNEAMASLTISLPVLCFGIFAFATPALVKRFGNVPVLTAAVLVMCAGALLRVFGGTFGLLGGTVLIGAGIAAGNVLVPVFIRLLRPDAVSRFTAYYAAILALSAAFGSILTGPALDAGIGWRTILLAWALVPAVIAAVWVGITRGWRQGPLNPKHSQTTIAEGGPQKTAAASLDAAPTTQHMSGSPMLHVLRAKRSWMITFLMGFQSLAFYSCTAWIPTQLADQGMSASAGSLALVIFNILGLITSFLAPRLVFGKHGKITWKIQAGLYVLGLLLLSGGGVVTWTGIVITGFVQGGVFAVALVFISNTPDILMVAPLSAFSQGVAYLLAAVGPTLMGWGYMVTGLWWVMNAGIALGICITGILGVLLLRETKTP
ncbi:MAG: MFS transporter [Actinomycetaceae bacterium]|nr:MFS transporter [Actinomycetaceae bacterium]